MKIINVFGNSDSSVVSIALTYGLRHNERIRVQGQGEAAVRQLYSVVASARDYLRDRGIALTVSRDNDSGWENSLPGPFVRLMVSADPSNRDEQDRTIGAEDSVEKQVAEDFEERQDMLSGENQLLEKLLEHNADKPILSGGDVDAAWDKAGVGQETVGGSVSTPDQDIVDLLGEAVGLTYEDDEPLGIDRKMDYRDEHRWMLDPRSAADADGAESANPSKPRDNDE